jgi:RNA polymerase sigma factor (sigma-70 family)
MPSSDRAFERLYRRYVRDVYRYVLAVLRNPAEAEDVTQTTFLNAYRALQAGEEPQKPHNWLIAIAHNACRSRIRFSMRRPKEVPLDAVLEQLELPDAERPNVRELLHVLGQLPFNQRAAITMRELEGRSYAEIAETLGVTVPAAEALIGRARRKLRTHASAIRGLGVVQLPQSLRSLLGRADAAGGGAVGSGAVGKAAALIVAGVLAGGVGLTHKGGAHAAKSEAPIAALVTPASTPAARRPHPHAAHRRAATAGTIRRQHAAASHGTSAPPPAAPTPAAPADRRPAPVPPAPSHVADQAQPATAPAPIQEQQPAQAAPVTETVANTTAAVGAAAQPIVAAVQNTVAAVSPPPLPAVPAVPAPPTPPPLPTP